MVLPDNAQVIRTRLEMTHKNKTLSKRNVKALIKRLKRVLEKQELDLLYFEQNYAELTLWWHKTRLRKTIEINTGRMEELKMLLNSFDKPRKKSKQTEKYDRRSYR